jgi:dienelactone hydrolase
MIEITRPKPLLIVMLKNLLSSLFFGFAIAAAALEEPPGTPVLSEGEVEAFLETVQKERLAAGKLDFDYPIRFDGVESSWFGGMLFEPVTAKALDIKNPMLSGKFPVLIYLHGCTGIDNNHDTRWAREVAKLGFVVIMPNSFSRPNRVSNCDPATKTAGRFSAAHVYRQEEIAYALARLGRETWADMKRVYLMGHSEGGIATATATFKEIKGIIISGWTCTNTRHPSMDGIRSSKDVPTLVLLYDKDPWFHNSHTEGDCSKSGAERADFTQKLFRGGIHGTFDAPGARDAVRSFLLRISGRDKS